MKLSILVISVFTLGVQLIMADPISAQDIDDVYVTVSLDGTSLKSAMKQIERQTNFRFAYINGQVSGYDKLYLTKEKRSLAQTLNLLLQHTSLRYMVKNSSILIVKKEQASTGTNNREAEPAQAISPPVIVTGYVRNDKGEPLSGATISTKGSSGSVVSNEEGYFSIEVPDENAVLVFSAVGYGSTEIKVGEQTSVNVALSMNAAKMDEVVVVGYGSQRKRNVTGAVAKVDMKPLETLPNTNVSQALRGRVAGVQFLDNGRPGQGGSILIRGQRSITASNDPLIVLDGVFFNGNLADINPNDIESMEILKDASASAIYGSRAANGVVLINSKKGSSSKPLIRFNVYGGLSDWSHQMKQLTPDRYIQKTLDVRKQSGQTADPSQIANYLTNTEAANYKNGISIDPWDEISQNGSIQSYDLSVSGRWDKGAYFLSAAKMFEKGLIMNDNADRTSFRMNVEAAITNWFKVGVTSQFSIRDLSGKEADTQQGYTLSPYGKLYFDSAKTDPVPYPVDDQIQRSPVLYSIIDQDEEKRQNLFANFFAVVNVPFLDGLSYRLNYSPNYRWEHRYTSSPIYRKNGLNNLGSASKYTREDFDWMVENILTYTRQFEKHGFDITLLYGQNQRNWESTTASASNFFTDVLSWNNLGLGQVQQSSSNAQQVGGTSAMARLNYQFMKRYLLTLTVRRDGSSVFGDNHKYGVFPSAAFAWIITDEKMMDNVSFMNFLKLRLSYGSVGNQAIGPYQSLSQSSTTQYVFGDGGTTSTGVYNSTMANPDLRWETTVSANAALDFELFRSRIGGTIEFYSMNTKDLLLNRALPSPTGFAQVLSNLGETKNNGIEFSLNTENIKQRKFQWTSNFVFSANKNRIVHLYGNDNNGDGVEDDDLGNRWFIGKPISINYDYELEGVYQKGDQMPAGQQPGFLKFKDLNADGKIDAADRTVISQREPKYRWGLGNTFKYDNFTFSFFFNAMTGWSQSFYLLDPVNNYPSRPVNMLDAGWWTEENQSTTRPSLVYTNPYGYQYYTNRDFIRLQDLSLSYDFNKAQLARLKMQGLRVYISGRNLLTFTDYVGQDPESGYNWAGYPTARTITAGFNISF